jgi:HPt (histidine-containing phosphotransfer) domain-containing protein
VLAAKSLQKFEGSFARDLDDLGSHVRGKAALAAAATVHKIKGAAANVSADAVRRLAGDLEELARADDLSQAEQLLAGLQAELARFRAWLPVALGKLSIDRPAPRAGFAGSDNRGPAARPEDRTTQMR